MTDSQPGFGASDVSGGVIKGLQAGYNRQFGRFLLGVELEGSAADIAGMSRCGLAIYVCDTTIDALGMLSLRGGYTFDRLLLYGKVGGALMHERYKMAPAPLTPPTVAPTETMTGKAWRTGWTVGAGLEYALTPSLSAKTEYNYLSFDGDVKATGNQGSDPTIALSHSIHLIKFGLNYKLGQRSPFERPLWQASGTPTHDWTGFYVGVHSGGGFGMSDWNSADGVLGAFSTQNFAGRDTVDGNIFGAQIGYNKQFGSWVVGAELAASWTNLDGYAKCATNAGALDSYVCHTRMSSLMTATARLGQAYDNFLIYGLAGGAFTQASHDAYRTGSGAELSGSARRTGYVLGSGIEYAFTPAFSGKVEYNFIDFGEKTVALSGATGTSTAAVGQNLHLVKLGLNYRLGADPRASHSTALFGKEPMAMSGWSMDVGLRYFYSNGKEHKDLGDAGGQINSRLIYGNMLAHSAETFVRLDHVSRVFIKGNFGVGSIVDGTMYDEDMPPAETPYSNTISSIRDSSLRYGSIDLGYNLIDGPAGKFGPYVGYQYFYQRGRAFGCQQVATNAGICGTTPTSTSLVGLTETETWRGVALGVNTQMKLAPRWKAEIDAAYLPYVDHTAVDNHWMRADINPASAPGHGWGARIEGVISYALTPRFSVGVGGRYQYFETTEASVTFPNSATGQPLKFVSDRYGAFLQASYRIGGTDADSFASDVTTPRVDWTGFYAGGHLGAGLGRTAWSDPFPAPTTGDRIDVGGALGGVQAGYNMQFGAIVAGAELSGSMARIGGTHTCFGGLVPATQAGLQCESKAGPLGTVTARAGYAFGRSMVYARAGAAVARFEDTLNSIAAGGGIDGRRGTHWGWTVGGGLEHSLNARWSVNVDYKYVDFGTRSVAFDVPAAAAAVTPNDIKSQQHLMTLGVNYHFTPMGR